MRVFPGALGAERHTSADRNGVRRLRNNGAAMRNKPRGVVGRLDVFVMQLIALLTGRFMTDRVSRWTAGFARSLTADAGSL